MGSIPLSRDWYPDRIGKWRLAGMAPQVIFQRRPFEQLHHDVRPAVDHVEVEDLHDARVAQGGDGLRLGAEAAEE